MVSTEIVLKSHLNCSHLGSWDVYFNCFKHGGKGDGLYDRRKFCFSPQNGETFLR